MWFVLLFTVFAMAIPIALEIYVKGSDNILSRSGKEISEWPLIVKFRKVFGSTKKWVYSLVMLGLFLIVATIVFQILAWLVYLIF
jgi:hypothetical protein